MSSDLPEFEKRPRARVMPLMHDVFGPSMVSLEAFPDGHFRVIFRRGVFTLADEAAEPSRSQWTTLKKRLKRRDHRVFIFREHGKAPCSEAGGDCYYLDFGFFLYD
ncbi:MAG: hypothetical protein SNJ54_05180 [Anaerolineae bacterium]